MSLITLTFGNKPYLGANAELVSSQAAYVDETIDFGVIEVQKVEKFLGTDEICVIGKLKEGIIELNMLAENNAGKIVEINSKYGGKIVAKPGANILLMLQNCKLSDLQGKQILTFKKPTENKEKKKGKFIIC